MARRQVTLVSTYPPRHCGIASFSEGLCNSLAEYVDVFVVAVNSENRQPEYSLPVRFVIEQHDLSSYERAADFINDTAPDVVCVEHEYGIFGGVSGAFLLRLLRSVHAPVVTGLHTVLRRPSTTQHHVLLDLASISGRLVVHGDFGAQFLQTEYGVAPAQIKVIPLGVKGVEPAASPTVKSMMGLSGRFVLLTTGFVSENKGIHNVIAAMPTIAAAIPGTTYVIAGRTHPVVYKHEGDGYLARLKRMAEELGVERHVLFWDRYLEWPELRDVQLAADIYLSPREDVELVSSGTLAGALATGRAIVATPYWNAIELLGDGTGIIVPFSSPGEIAKAVIALAENPSRRVSCQERAWQVGRTMLWQNVTRDYLSCFEEVMSTRRASHVPNSPLGSCGGTSDQWNLDHIVRLTDRTGIAQHAVLTVPNRKEGYCTDDNARALRLSALVSSALGTEDKLVMKLASTYLAFLWHAFDDSSGRMRNFLGYDRRWTDEVGSEECHGRALWGLASVMTHSSNAALRDCAAQLFAVALSQAQHFGSPRAWGYVILAVEEHLHCATIIPKAREIHNLLAERLLLLYRRHATVEWPWFEDQLTYFNALLPNALLAAGESTDEKELLEVGLSALQWLVTLQEGEDGCFSPVGNRGFYVKGNDLAKFDQQPVEAKAMTSACVRAYRITGDRMWLHKARWAYEWFLGRNSLGLSLYDGETGGCRDGLHALGANQNQGAESTLAFWLATQELASAESPRDHVGELPGRS